MANEIKFNTAPPEWEKVSNVYISAPPMNNEGKFKHGTRFRGNVNGAEMEVVKIQGTLAVIKNLKTGDVISYGLKALEHCDVTILE